MNEQDRILSHNRGISTPRALTRKEKDNRAARRLSACRNNSSSRRNNYPSRNSSAVRSTRFLSVRDYFDRVRANNVRYFAVKIIPLAAQWHITGGNNRIPASVLKVVIRVSFARQEKRSSRMFVKTLNSRTRLHTFTHI